MRAKYMRSIKVSEGKSIFKKIARFLLKSWYSLIPLCQLNRKYFSFATKYSLESSSYVHCSYGRYGMRNYFKKEVFGERIYVVFEDIMLPIPVGYKEILTQFYGNYDEFPPNDVIKAGLEHTSIYLEEETTDNL